MSGKLFGFGDHPERIASEAHAVVSLRGAVEGDVVGLLSGTRYGAFGVDEIFVDGRKTGGSADGLNVGILAIEIGDVL